MDVTSDKRYRFTIRRDDLWSAITRLEDYRRWWPWLRRFDARKLAPGEVWTCVVQPPLPYSLAFTITLGEVEPPQLVTATIAGDITGTARLEVCPDGHGCQARLLSRLAPADRVLQGVASLAPPLARFGHDWVLRTGLRQFVSRAV